MTENERRLQREAKIGRKLINELISRDYRVSINDGEDTVINRSRDASVIIKAMAATDEDYVSFYIGEKQAGWFRLIYGNDTDLISDHSANDATQTIADAMDAYLDKL